MNWPRLTFQSKEAELTDSSGNEVGTTTNRFQVESRDTDTFNTFEAILKELRIMNVYLSDMANVGIVKKSDLE